jgi:hypothetical protein
VGGNLINVTFNGAKTNLHSIWDTAIPQKSAGNFSQANALSWATNLTSEIKHGQYKKESKSWIKGIDVKDAVDSSMIWASDANSYVCSDKADRESRIQACGLVGRNRGGSRKAQPWQWTWQGRQMVKEERRKA